jgi:hypothetical protein
MNLIIIIFLTFFNRIMCQDDTRPEEFGFYFIHNPAKFTPEVLTILKNVVTEYNSFYHYTNKTQICPTTPTVTCPPPIVMDSPCDYMPSNDPDSLGYFVSILLITLTNLGLLCFGLWKGYEMFKTKINPFRINAIRVDPLTQ